MRSNSHREQGGRAGSVPFLLSKDGQGLIESCIVVALVCLVFFAIFQLSQLYASQEVLDYAAARGARAKSVGFNHFMIRKTIEVGAIPNAGRMLTPAYAGGPSQEHALERARIPLYLGAENAGRLPAILAYEDWATIGQASISLVGDGTLRATVAQAMPLKYPFHRAFYAGDSVMLGGTNTIDAHYDLYMQDLGW